MADETETIEGGTPPPVPTRLHPDDLRALAELNTQMLMEELRNQDGGEPPVPFEEPTQEQEAELGAGQTPPAPQGGDVGRKWGETDDDYIDRRVAERMARADRARQAEADSASRGLNGLLAVAKQKYGDKVAELEPFVRHMYNSLGYEGQKSLLVGNDAPSRIAGFLALADERADAARYRQNATAAPVERPGEGTPEKETKGLPENLKALFEIAKLDDPNLTEERFKLLSSSNGVIPMGGRK